MFSHQLRYFSSKGLIVTEGQTTIAICELCGQVYLMQVDQLSPAPSDITQETIIEALIDGTVAELDKPLHEGGVIIKEYTPHDS